MFPPLKNKSLAAMAGASHASGPMGKEVAKPEEAQMDEKEAPLHAAAGDIINAVHNKSAHEVHAAMQNYLSLHKHHEEEKEHEEHGEKY